MSLTADDLVVIGKGRLIAQSSTDEFIRQAGDAAVKVRAPQLSELSEILTKAGAAIRHADSDALLVSGMDSAAIGELAAVNGMTLHELSPQTGSLEEAFMQLTGDSVEYHTQSVAG
jgi:ABC-2 type transport system ATP-binding protein